METIKFVIIGDGNVGKTCMVLMYTRNIFPDDYIPTVLEDYTIVSSYQNKPHQMLILDTAGQEEYAYLRPISYTNTNVFFICFSIIEPTSFVNAETVWHWEAQHFCPQAICILVGTKKDLRDDEDTILKLRDRGKAPITYEQGQALAKKIKAHRYLECSAMKRIGLKDIFDYSVQAHFERKAKPPKRRVCSVL